MKSSTHDDQRRERGAERERLPDDFRVAVRTGNDRGDDLHAGASLHLGDARVDGVGFGPAK